MLRSRRRPRYGAQLCALTAAVLLLLSVSLLHSRISIDRPQPRRLHTHVEPLLDYTNEDERSQSFSSDTEDRIDVLDDIVHEEGNAVSEDQSSRSSQFDEEEDKDEVGLEENEQTRASGYFLDHFKGVIRRAFKKRSIDEWEDYVPFDSHSGSSDVKSVLAFGSDDIPVDENIREKMGDVKTVEDLLLLKDSPLRKGWGEWFDKKSDFLRKDQMFKSNVELLNPMNNPLLQDPDGVGNSGFTRGDKLLLKGLLDEFKKVPFLGKKPLGLEETKTDLKPKFLSKIIVNCVKNEFQIYNSSYNKKIKGATEALNVIRSLRVQEKNVENKWKVLESNAGKLHEFQSLETDEKIKPVLPGQMYADGKRWGYFPGLNPHLTFSNFMNGFFRNVKCSTRFFMVWNSPPWMFSVRHQRVLESILYHHRDACVVVFSETIELDFFHGFVKDGFKVAVVMPNLDELLTDTPVHVFASFYFEWRKTKYYATHYSELVRLAALYKYGGIYLDFDVVVLKELFSLNNSVGLEDGQPASQLNGAVMVFRKHSSFIMECMQEFYLAYNESCLRCNGADLLTKVARKFLSGKKVADRQEELIKQSSFVFFPISRNNITRFFAAPATEGDVAKQDVVFKSILNQSVTFHFWNSLTYALVPEPESLVTRLINHPCIRCSDVL